MERTITPATNTTPNKPVNARLLSLDFLRGLTVATMLLVNDPGDWGHIYPPLEHSKWNGCTPTDLVFPFFLFMVGVSIVFAMQGKKADPAAHGKLIASVIRRTLTILAIGILVPVVLSIIFADYSTTGAGQRIADLFTHLRYPGVLSRIAVVFGITSFVFIKTTTKTQVFIAAGCLIGYYLLMTLVPVPGFGAANLEPATNLGAWLDRAVFGVNHLWSQSKIWDPESLLGTIPAVGHCLIGVLVGTYLKRDGLASGKDLLKLARAGFLMIAFGFVWNYFFPINKALWTSSFVLYTCGLATVILCLCYWLIDIKGYRKLIAPFVAFGRNAITTYVLADIIPDVLGHIPVTANGIKTNLWSYLYNLLFVPYLSPVNASLAGAILMVLIIFLPIWLLYVKKIIIRV